MAFRRRMRGFRRPRIKTQWTGNSVTDGFTITPGNAAQVEIVSVEDYADTDTIEPGATTLLRLHGHVTIGKTASGFHAGAFGIFKVDDGVTIATGTQNDPVAFAAQRNGNCLYLEHFMLTGNTFGDYGAVHRIKIDIKSKRKLEYENIVAVWTNISTSGENLLVYCGFRALITAP